MKKRNPYLAGAQILPQPLQAGATVTELVDQTFLAYNAARLKEACQLFAEKMLQPEVTIGLSLTGALTPAGLGISAIIPLIQHGFIDWIVSTGANLYHDTHFGLDLDLRKGTPFIDDRLLREEGVVRIYDIFFDYHVLLNTDAFYREIIHTAEFQKTMSSADFHHLCGKYIREREKLLGIQERSLLAVAYEHGVPVYTSSPGDSSIGMNVAAMALQGSKLQIDVSRDVNETAAIVLQAKRSGGRSAVVIMGGGSPKNFMLQTEPQIQEVLGIAEKGHDYFLQITDARPDTGGLSGATPSEAVSWGKVDPNQLPDSVVCYLDSTVALPIMVAYALTKKSSRPHKRLMDHKDQYLENLQRLYIQNQKSR